MVQRPVKITFQYLVAPLRDAGMCKHIYFTNLETFAQQTLASEQPGKLVLLEENLRRD